MSSQKVYRTITLFLHGLLAGLSLWHIISTFVLSREAKTKEKDSYLLFIDLYQPLAMPVQCGYYLLAVLCTVSVCDRLVLVMFYG